MERGPSVECYSGIAFAVPLSRRQHLLSQHLQQNGYHGMTQGVEEAGNSIFNSIDNCITHFSSHEVFA